MSEFTPAYQKTLAAEGAYSNDPRDRGGETYKGIARNMNPRWEGWDVIDAIKANTNKDQLLKAMAADEELEQLVADFYKLVYFDPLMLSQITEQDIANELFDTAVNQGTGIAVKHFQVALNLLNNNQKHYSDISEDGKMGEGSLKAYRAYMLTANFPGRSVEKNTKTLLKAMSGLQFMRYADICNRDPLQEVYFYGWLNRI